MAQHIYTIAADRPFLATVARGLLDLAEGEPLRLARMTVLLPTRRAVRALREAFLRLSGEEGGTGAPLLLPRLRPIGDIEADEIALGADDPSLAIPPAVPMGTAKVEPAAEPKQIRRTAAIGREAREIPASQFGRVRALTSYGMTRVQVAELYGVTVEEIEKIVRRPDQPRRS